ncbi:MAG TPA: hypothetical protein ACFCUC_18125 [Desulfobacterales bacterium]
MPAEFRRCGGILDAMARFAAAMYSVHALAGAAVLSKHQSLPAKRAELIFGIAEKTKIACALRDVPGYLVIRNIGVATTLPDDSHFRLSRK